MLFAYTFAYIMFLLKGGRPLFCFLRNRTNWLKGKSLVTCVREVPLSNLEGGTTYPHWLPFCGMWCRVVLVWTDVSEHRITSIFRVEESASEEPERASSCSWFLARRFFYPEDGGNTFLRIVDSHKNYMAPHPRKRQFAVTISCLSDILPLESQLLFPDRPLLLIWGICRSQSL
jgi:hypothetical protein